MKAPVDSDDGKDSRVMSLSTIDEKVASSLSQQATIFANIFEKRAIVQLGSLFAVVASGLIL